MLAHLSLQLLVLLRAVVREWHEIEVLVSIQCLHARVTIVEAILPRDLVASWKVIDALKAPQIVVNV